MNLCILDRHAERGWRALFSRVVAVALLAFAGRGTTVAQDIDPTSDVDVQPYAGTPVSGYRLAWSDEFNGTNVNTAKWNYRTGVRLWSTQLPANNSVSNGLYYLHVKKETVGATDYTAGGIISKKAVRYGYYETRMRVPPGRGWHTSFWMMYNGTPTNNVHIELDVLENDSVNLFKYGVNTHRHQPTPHVTFGNKNVNTPSLNADFHVLGCEFTPTTIKYFFEGALVQTVDATQFAHNDMNIWLTSVAANLGGTTNVDDSMLPNVAEYEYARFFTLGPTSTVAITTPSFLGATLADTNHALHVSALVTTSDTNYPPSVTWSKLSGPGGVTFANATNTDTTATFSYPGNYVLQCQSAVLTSTNSDTVTVAVAAPLSLALRQGVGGYAHIATFIRGDSVNWNSGGRDQFIVGRWGGLGMRGLLSFDLAGLDTNAVIQSATLDLWTDPTAGAGTVGPLELRTLNAIPVEGTGDGSSSANGAGTGATWLSRTGGTNVSDMWTTPGGDFGTNVVSTIPGYDATVINQQRTFGSTSNFVSVVQAALAADEPLNLLVISPETEAGTNNYISRISSDDNFNVAQRPLLSLRFLGNFAPALTPGSALVTLTNLPTPLTGSVTNAEGSAWSKASGAGTVSFANAANPSTTATFNAPGEYLLRLTASNSLAQVSRDVPVTVVGTAPQLGSPLVTDNQFQFQISGASGVTYTVQASTNLVAWANLFSTNASVTPFIWTDSAATNFPQQFYRVLLGP
jgi:beta-glucanase (GH16 family)